MKKTISIIIAALLVALLVPVSAWATEPAIMYWNAEPDAAGYVVYKSTDGGATWIAQGVTAETEWLFADAPVGTLGAVKTYDAYGNKSPLSDASNPRPVKPQPLKPNKPWWKFW